ncbi:MAG: PaaI family thioesterase [Hyphomonadaceae bacterium]|nr:PaaI family thioesterase [Hyphomonadaceae bacterium]
MTEGPFAGWTTWGKGADPYETLIGPFFFKIDDQGEALCAFEPRQEHRNGAGFIHGGLLMSFADFALFSFAYRALGDLQAVTLTCNSEFMSAGVVEDGVIEARGEVLRETRSLLFVRGLMTQRGRGVLAFSGALKKIGA